MVCGELVDLTAVSGWERISCFGHFEYSPFNLFNFCSHQFYHFILDSFHRPMNEENWPLVTDNLHVRNNELKLKTSGKLPIYLEESMEYTSN